MSVANARSLIRKMGQDAAFRQRVESASPSQKKALLEADGFGDVTPDDVQAVAAGVGGAELSDSELEAVAGGRLVEWVAATAACVGAAAAAA